MTSKQLRAIYEILKLLFHQSPTFKARTGSFVLCEPGADELAKFRELCEAFGCCVAYTHTTTTIFSGKVTARTVNTVAVAVTLPEPLKVNL